jgi:DNA repair protein RecO (recombination protein O)
MSEIIKTEAVVLSKINYGDTSSIVSLYTEKEGKISAILKGSRVLKSKLGQIVDPLNHLQIIIYKKVSRDVQLISSADLISHFSKIKENLDCTKYSFAIMELLKNLTSDNEVNPKLFRGLVKILRMIEDKKEDASILFGRFFLFFLSELGYEISVEKCSNCGNKLSPEIIWSFDFELGFVCSDCVESYFGKEIIDAELFNYFVCLKNNKSTGKISIETQKKFLTLLERYLKQHVPDFKGILSFQTFK